MSLGLLCPARAVEQGAVGTAGVSSTIGPGECQAIREACVACFDISSCQTIN